MLEVRDWKSEVGRKEIGSWSSFLQQELVPHKEALHHLSLQRRVDFSLRLLADDGS